MMNIFVVSGSPRKGGNTDIMAQAFAQGARSKGHQVTVQSLSGLKIAPCLGCQYCFAHQGQCVQKDDMAGLLEQVDQADMLVFASPVYWFDLTAQLKCFIDRLYARGKVGFRHTKTALLLDSGAPGVYEAAIAQYRAMGAYLHWQDMGIVTIPDMKQKGDMAESPLLEQARALGASLE